MVGGRRTNCVAVELDGRPGSERMDLDRKPLREVAQLEHPLNHPFRIGRPIDVERVGSVVEAHALNEPGETKEVVPVEMRDEDAADFHERDRGMEELSLGPFAAVQENELSFGVERNGARRTVLGGPGTCGSQEGDLHRVDGGGGPY